MQFIKAMTVPALVGLVVGLSVLLVDARRTPVEPVVRAPAPLSAGETYAAAVARAAPAVVNIYTRKRVAELPHPLLSDPFFQRFFGSRGLQTPEQRESSLGSGVIMTADGYVLTNHHVIADAEEILILLRDGRQSPARLVGVDPETDLAVLQVDIAGVQPIEWAPQETVRVGDVVLAIGNPFGVGQTVTMGIVGATGRHGLGLNTYENFIQTDAAINPGNSGGALVDSQGRLVGINTAIYSRNGGSMGLGFAIPTPIAAGVMQALLERGQVVRGWLGIEARQVAVPSVGGAPIQGILVTRVIAGGPADLAGLLAGDVITGLGDLAVADGRAAMDRIAQMSPGTPVEVTGVRAGGPFQARVVLGRRPRAATG